MGIAFSGVSPREVEGGKNVRTLEYTDYDVLKATTECKPTHAHSTNNGAHKTRRQRDQTGKTRVFIRKNRRFSREKPAL